MNTKRVKIALVAVLAFMLLGATMVSASSNYKFDFDISVGEDPICWGYKDDYADADVNFKANSNWQQGDEYFVARLLSDTEVAASKIHTVHFAGLFHMAYQSPYSQPGERGLNIAYPSGQPYTNATAYGVWAP